MLETFTSFLVSKFASSAPVEKKSRRLSRVDIGSDAATDHGEVGDSPLWKLSEAFFISSPPRRRTDRCRPRLLERARLLFARAKSARGRCSDRPRTLRPISPRA